MLSAVRKQLGLRAIGSSEIGIIARVSQHSTIHDLWLEKTGLSVRAENDDTPAQLVGQYLEEGAARLYEHMMGCRLRNPGKTYVHPLHEWCVATPDRIEEYQTRIVEIKLPGRWARGWDFRVDDGLPANVLFQAQWQMEAIGIHANDVFAVAGTEPHVFSVEYSAEMAADLLTLGDEFLRKYVIPCVPPPPDGSEAAGKAIAAKWKQKSKNMLAPTPYARDLVEQIRELKAKAKAADTAAKLKQQEMCALIGDYAGFDGLCTWQADSVGKVAWKGVAEAYRSGLEMACRDGSEIGAKAMRLIGESHEQLLAMHRGEPPRKFLVKGEKE